jgi:hypothetical protein
MLVERRKPRMARVGIFGVGHHTYWPQFAGLREELLGYMWVVAEQVLAATVGHRRPSRRPGGAASLT